MFSNSSIGGSQDLPINDKSEKWNKGRASVGVVCHWDQDPDIRKDIFCT